jgi:hypothetical protein
MIADEKYIFKPATKQKLYILIAVGLFLFVLGVFLAQRSGHHEGGEKHASIEIAKTLVASSEPAKHGEANAAEAHHGSAIWLKRIYTSLAEQYLLWWHWYYWFVFYCHSVCSASRLVGTN